MNINIENIGRTVLCDICNKEWTDSPQSGGLIFSNWAYCPDCAENGLKNIKECGEEQYIDAFCPPDLSFGDFVRKWRGGDGIIEMRTFDSNEEFLNHLFGEGK